MAYLIKTLLTTISTTANTLYKNTRDNGGETVAKNIYLFNTSGSSVDVSLSFAYEGDDFKVGAVLYEYPLAAKTGIYVEAERIMIPDFTIQAYASTDDVVSISIDITGGDTGHFQNPLP